jgi:putative peptidoglycan lipid II flippase
MEGSVTAILFAFTLMLMPQAAIAQSIATAALPTFSMQVARNELTEMRASLAASLRGILLLSIPASLGLMLLNYSIVQLIYQRGEFTAYSTRLVSWALLWYAAGLVGHAMVEILSRAFYALHDTRTPVVIGITAMSLNVAFSYGFSALFRGLGWLPHGGLALANTLATALEMVGLLLIMRKRLSGLNGSSIQKALLAALGSGAAMSAAILGWKAAADSLPNAVFALGGILIGILVYGTGLWLLRNKELRSLVGALRSRLANQ